MYILEAIRKTATVAFFQISIRGRWRHQWRHKNFKWLFLTHLWTDFDQIWQVHSTGDSKDRNRGRFSNFDSGAMTSSMTSWKIQMAFSQAFMDRFRSNLARTFYKWSEKPQLQPLSKFWFGDDDVIDDVIKILKGFLSVINGRISIKFGKYILQVIPKAVIVAFFKFRFRDDDVIDEVIKTSNGFFSAIYGPISIKFVMYIIQVIPKIVTVADFQVSIQGLWRHHTKDKTKLFSNWQPKHSLQLSFCNAASYLLLTNVFFLNWLC